MKYTLITLICLHLLLNPHIFAQTYQQVRKHQVQNILQNICTDQNGYEFVDLYSEKQTIKTNEYLKLTTLLKKRGFAVVSHGRGNWELGSRIVSFTLENATCSCQIDKLYYSSTKTKYKKYRTTERVKCIQKS